MTTGLQWYADCTPCWACLGDQAAAPILTPIFAPLKAGWQAPLTSLSSVFMAPVSALLDSGSELPARVDCPAGEA